MRKANDQLAILGGPKTIEQPGPHFKWPLITDETREAVMRQLEESVSYYKKQGVFARFEDRFAEYHGLRKALLNSSGTSALHAMYVGVGLKPGDEVICPTYTFYATVTPLLQVGAMPVFCDAQLDGNIDPNEVRKLINPKTRAIVVTHMWGIPCEMDQLVQIARDNNLKLLEDCSHAHGATFDGKLVGTFGDAAAWSLQGQKTLTGGEGGIIATNNDDVFERALSLGHYNKRCSEEVGLDSPWRQFALTGFGLKLRAHPLAIAMAEQQFNHMDDWLRQRREFATQLMEDLRAYSALTLPNVERREPSWYAFTVQFNPEKVDGVQVSRFFDALKAEGLVEADQPGSTCPIHALPLFQHMDVANPAAYSENPSVDTNRTFPGATHFYERAIKIPVWALPEDRAMMQKYSDGFKKVLDNVNLLKED